MKKIIKKMVLYATNNFIRFAILLNLNLWVVFKILPGRTIGNVTIGTGMRGPAYYLGSFVGLTLSLLLLKKIVLYIAYPKYHLSRKKNDKQQFSGESVAVSLFSAILFLECLVLAFPFVGLAFAYIYAGGVATGAEIPTMVWVGVEFLLWGLMEIPVYFPKLFENQ